VAVVGNDVVDVLFPHGRFLGKQIQFGGKSFRIIGVYETRGKMFGQSLDNFVVIPFRTYDKLFSSDRFTYTNVTVRAVSQEALPEAISQATFLMRGRRGVKPDEDNNFEIFTQDTLVEAYRSLTGAVFVVMIGIASIALLVGGIGIMNVMLATVSERTREIGIRKAIGARRSHIIRQFLLEAIMLTGGGGVIGLLLGFGIAKLVSTTTPLPSSVPIWAVALGLGICVSVGLFFGIFPAFRAAKLDPVEALRYE
jgi:putative ABC transport system permease protein